MFPDPLAPVFLQDFGRLKDLCKRRNIMNEWQVHRILGKLMRQGGSLAHDSCFTGERQLCSAQKFGQCQLRAEDGR